MDYVETRMTDGTVYTLHASGLITSGDVAIAWADVRRNATYRYEVWDVTTRTGVRPLLTPVDAVRHAARVHTGDVTLDAEHTTAHLACTRCMTEASTTQESKEGQRA